MPLAYIEVEFDNGDEYEMEDIDPDSLRSVEKYTAQ